MKTSQIFKIIEDTAPLYLAEKWDNCGLQVGSYKQKVSKILLTLDVTPAVVNEAIEKKVDLIISHHPFIFNGLKKIWLEDQKGKMIAQLLSNNITLYSAHTNLDKANLGLNDYIAKKIQISEALPLEPEEEKLYKIAIYVPVDYTEKIVNVLGESGAGFIGNYSHCTYRTMGKGTFKPLKGTNPFIGEEGEFATVEENRIETIVDGRMVKSLIKKIKTAHPYEEMAYDLFPLENGKLIMKHGLGKIGILEKPMVPIDFINHVKTSLNLEHVRVAGKPPKKISRVALCTGSGAEFMGVAKVRKADVYITGDLKYHEAQRAYENNLWVIDAGHFGSEKMVVDLLKELIDKQIEKDQIETIISTKNEDFMRFY